MGEWLIFLHPPREHLAETLTETERELFAAHFAYLEQLLAAGSLILAGPTLGPINTGVMVFEAPDEEAARAVMENDPAVAGGIVRAELRPYRLSLLRGRDEP